MKINQQYAIEAFIGSFGILLFNVAMIPFLYAMIGAKVTHLQGGIVSLVLLLLRWVWLYFVKTVDWLRLLRRFIK